MVSGTRHRRATHTMLHFPAWAGIAAQVHTELAPQQALSRLAHLPYPLLLHSARPDPNLGRYSFLMADPFAWLEVPPDANKPLAQLSDWLNTYREVPQPGLPPFQGGAAGLLAYDLNRSLESLPAPQITDFPIPAVAVGLYDTVFAWDHNDRRCWIISQGFPEIEFAARRRRAAERIEQFLDGLNREDVAGELQGHPSPEFSQRSASRAPSPGAPLEFSYPIKSLPGLNSNFSEARYLEMIERAKAYIAAGDVYQVNLAQRLLAPATASSLELYRRLSAVNPAPFSAFFDLGSAQIISCSPERFLAVRDRQVETRPIKGTRRRTRVPLVDLAAVAELQSSEKDRAENVMIVDLMRSDLSRVCDDDSVQVTQLLATESYQSVIHLVSAIRGRLRDDASLVDLIEATFPGGSITGCPKIRAMEIIAELEPTARGAYCGSLGYLGFDGTADLSILIRTITAADGRWQIPVGGGVVALSDPQEEYRETWTKAAGMLQAIHPEHPARQSSEVAP